MKKALVIIFIWGISSTGLFAQTQNQGDVRAHAFGSYGLRWKNFGAGAGLEYFFMDQFAIKPSYTRLFPRVGQGSNFSLDLRYYISEGSSQMYFMGGYSQNWETPNTVGAPGVTRSFKGANVGVGAYISLADWVGLSTEFRVQSQNPREAGFRFGFAFPL
ncbi:MAG: hypothetical protein ACQEW9_06355 [Bacteroidota bacterium]|uniref:Outer membrane protein beta-barrel domain-containing protein n=1 Tax=Algoriphagus faecimaris TaxID=686796 RepID=A0A1G6P3N0_9BACT|nr:hypothetical protein [Algoriphagus faecimaris]SDC74782.1 hypothetical protein SAMN04488104_100537 [Algoriphagus faecimaris]